MDNSKRNLKGNYGEEMVKNFLESRGFVVYEPVTNKAHPFDKLIVKGKTDFRIVEVKTKPKMKYHNATGVDIRHWNDYTKAKSILNIPIYIFFVDNLLGSLLYQEIDILGKPFTDEYGKLWPNETISRGIILFHINQLINARDLTPDEINYLNSNTQSDYD